MATYIVEIGYKTPTGSRQEHRIECCTLEQAEQVRNEQVEIIKNDAWLELRYSHIKINEPAGMVQPATPTHWKITAKSFSGGYYSALVPITADLDAALDKIDDDLKIIGIEKVIRPPVGTGITTSRLHTRG